MRLYSFKKETNYLFYPKDDTSNGSHTSNTQHATSPWLSYAW